MALKFGKKELEQMIETLQADYIDVGEAAKAVLAKAEELVNARSQFIVVGQVVATREKGRVDPSDPDAVKLALGPFSTAGDAQSAAGSLWSSTASGDTLKCWALPFFHGSPHDWHGTQRAKYQEAEAKRKTAQNDKLQESIKKHQQAAQERADNMREEQAA